MGPVSVGNIKRKRKGQDLKSPSTIQNKVIWKMDKKRRERIERGKKDKEWSLTVRTRDKSCQVCGKWGKRCVDAHHIIPRGFSKTRLDLMNGICLCKGCHKFRAFSAHKNGFWFSDWLATNKPEQYDYLLRKCNEV